ncbi:MAG TPA: DUF3761 domain-containing protein [Pseudonocardia sp.]|nr:DUF3761 domain-containing protein [Pseudonocardia sp.]
MPTAPAVLLPTRRGVRSRRAVRTGAVGGLGFLSLAAAVVLLIAPAPAQPSSVGPALTLVAYSTGATPDGMALPSGAPVTASACEESANYVNSSGNCVHRPEASGSAPAGATAQCKDGEYSLSQHRAGTCSGHGGVSQWL